jgi:hypothetical protein
MVCLAQLLRLTANVSKHFFFPAVALAVVFTSMTCQSPTEPLAAAFTIELADTTCTEAWLSVHLDHSISQRRVEIKRDDSVVMAFAMMQTDTTVSDTGLLPNKSYTYIAQLKSGTSVSKPTPELRVQTLDTTSNDFSWTTYSLGNGGATSSLYDVAIVSETPPLAYAVGEIHADSGSFNAARWDGNRWALQHIPVKLTYIGSSIVTDQVPLTAIYAFSDSDIWVTSRVGGVSHWNGSQWVMLDIPFNQGPVATHRIWGPSSDDLYFVGDEGRVVHYRGSGWTHIPSGTSLNVQDIYGAWDPVSRQYEILAVASNPFSEIGKDLLSVNSTRAAQIATDPIPYPVGSTWFIPGKAYFVVGNGVFEKHLLSDARWTGSLNATPYYLYQIRGGGVNDVVAVGGYGEFLHFNGKNWKSFYDKTHSSGNLYSVAIKGSLVIAVGQTASQGFAVIGKRSP